MNMEQETTQEKTTQEETTENNPTMEIPLTELFLQSLNEKERKSYHIAKDHLGTSFQLEKSVGFIQFCKHKPT